MLAPYAGGAARSRLLSILSEGHYDVRPAPDELERCLLDRP